jgi:thymidylate synthase
MRTIEETDISTAWAKAFLSVIARGVNEISPLVVSVAVGDEPLPERADIRAALDECIDGFKSSDDERFTKLQTVHTVANTIFPYSLWNPNAENDAELLYDRFAKSWPRLKKCTQNRRGSYFRRLTAFRAKKSEDEPINQLKHIVETYGGGNHRRSALQASVFDPALDHVNSRQLGFPCLHQVSFAPVGEDGLAVTGFYATQYIVDRAYGNYLGLCRLGEFMAKQLDLKLAKMTCIASIAQRGTPNKGELGDLANRLTPLIPDGEESSE